MHAFLILEPPGWVPPHQPVLICGLMRVQEACPFSVPPLISRYYNALLYYISSSASKLGMSRKYWWGQCWGRLDWCIGYSVGSLWIVGFVWAEFLLPKGKWNLTCCVWCRHGMKSLPRNQSVGQLKQLCCSKGFWCVAQIGLLKSNNGFMAEASWESSCCKFLGLHALAI